MNKKLLYTYKFLEKTNAKILKSTHTFKNFTHEELSLSWRIKKNTVHSKKKWSAAHATVLQMASAPLLQL